MGRPKRDPVEAAFSVWCSLTAEQKVLFGASVKGYEAAALPSVAASTPKPKRVREPKVQPEATE